MRRSTAAGLVAALAVASALVARADDPAEVAHDPLAAYARDGLVIDGGSANRLVLFTFDDGPNEDATPALLDELDRAGVHGVFFMVARRLEPGRAGWEARVAVARDAVRRGHTIGYHTFDHTALARMTDRELGAQLDRGEAIYRDVFGGRPWLFRPPGGERTARADRFLAARGYTTVLHSHHVGDWQVSNAEQARDVFRRSLRRMARHGRPGGGIVVLHDTHRRVAETFRLIFEELAQRNCDLLARNEELFDFADDPRLFYVPRGDARPGTVAPLFRLDAATLAARQARARVRAAAWCDPTRDAGTERGRRTRR